MKKKHFNLSLEDWQSLCGLNKKKCIAVALKLARILKFKKGIEREETVFSKINAKRNQSFFGRIFGYDSEGLIDSYEIILYLTKRNRLVMKKIYEDLTDYCMSSYAGVDDKYQITTVVDIKFNKKNRR